jgi:hypothetical protein
MDDDASPALPVLSAVEGSRAEGPALPVLSAVEGSKAEGPARAEPKGRCQTATCSRSCATRRPRDLARWGSVWCARLIYKVPVLNPESVFKICNI